MIDSTLKIVILEPSQIICSGIAATLKRLKSLHLNTVEINIPESPSKIIKLYNPDIIIANPIYYTPIDIQRFINETHHLKKIIIALNTHFFDGGLIGQFDEYIGMYDKQDVLLHKLKSLIDKRSTKESEEESSGVLSQREKDIIANLVQGKTNREIAKELFISPHTVNTHRRNISRKLGIHSSSGLTLYAIINKIIDIQSISLTE